MSLASLCNPATFASLPALFGTEILSVEATVASYNATMPTYTFTQPTRELSFEYCNATVGYTHPGQADTIYVEMWLPSPEAWNGRLLGVGGGGLEAGRNVASFQTMMAPAVQDGFAAITTDAGVRDPFGGWGLLNRGNLNLINIDNFGSRALEEQGLLGKSLVEIFYGKKQSYSYFTGCSQGGRQALTVSQRFPDLYDGIFASAPAVSNSRLLPSIHWPQQFMSQSGSVPHACELDAITAAAIAFCDELDGVKDGIVADSEACLEKFDPESVVGQEISCADAEGGKLAVSKDAAAVASAVWHGLTTARGQKIWAGPAPSADLTGNHPRTNTPGLSVANTNCTTTSDGVSSCVGVPFPQSHTFFRSFLARDPDLDVAGLSQDDFDALVRYGLGQLRSMDALETDLGELAHAGTKMISFHGVDDNIIPVGTMTDYYGQVLASSSEAEVQDFYRLFTVPGLMHCLGGNGGYPDALFGQLMAWVENGTAPEQSPYEVMASVPGSGPAEEEIQQRVLCPFPKKAVRGGETWTCQ